MKTYFETKLGRLYHGDCLEIMPELRKVNLCLTDPPYGLGVYASGTMGGGVLAKQSTFAATNWDFCIPSKKIFELIFDKSSNQIIFGGNYFIDYLYATPCFLVWNKDNGNNNFADCELAWTSFRTATRIIKWRWQGMLKEARETRYHPTQKPVGLFAWILEKYSKSNDIILDSFLGSGTTVIACERLNRRWIGIEKEEKYCEIAAKRIEAEASQLKLFA